MSMSTGVSNNSPIANLSISDPRCNNDSCSAFKAAHAASQAAVSYTWQFEYGHWTTWYYIIIIGFFTGIHALRLWRLRCAKGLKDHSKQPNLLDRARACRRSITYRRLHGETFNSLGLPSFGILLFMLATLTLFVVATFAVQPYYREHRGYGSPPLAVRTGLMAVACTPILVALAGKANVITLLTGYGHEKLNVIHRYVAWMCFGLSVVHTIPFIVAPLNDGGYAQLHAQFYKTGSFEVCSLLAFRACKTCTNLRLVHRGASSGHAPWTCCVFHPLDTTPILRDFLASAHFSRAGLHRPDVLARRPRARFMGIHVGHACCAIFVGSCSVLLLQSRLQCPQRVVCRIAGCIDTTVVRHGPHRSVSP